MITDKDILARLVAGESIDDIMSEITKNVNSALQEKEKLDKEAEEKRAAAEKARLEAEAQKKAEKQAMDKKRTAVRSLLDGIADAAEAWGWDEIAQTCDEADEADIDDLIEMIDTYGQMFKMYAQIGNLTFPLGGSKAKPEVKAEKKPEVATKEKKPVSAEEAILRFLSGNGLI